MINKLQLTIAFSLIYLAGAITAVRAILADNPPPIVLINEVLADTTISATDEFIELINNSAQIIDLTGWKIEYMSAVGTNWTSKAELYGKLYPRDFLLIATDYLIEQRDFRLSSGLARGGGHLRITGIMNNQQVEIDRVGWRTASSALSQAAPAGQTGQSLKRLVDEDGWPIYTQNNLSDFKLSTLPTPQASLINRLLTEAESSEEPEPEQVVITPPVIETPSPPPSPQTVSPASYTIIKLTELFVDPAAPLNDKDDEFVEIYNPHSFPVDIGSYVIQTGIEFRYSFKLPSFVLNPGKYLAVYSIDSKLVLSNSTGQARLLDPNGNVIDKTTMYEKTKPNHAWALNGSTWMWTKTPTPHAPNQFDEESLAAAQVASLSKGKAINTSTSSSLSANTNTSQGAYQEPESSQNNFSQSVLVWGGVIALLYGAYEYRSEIIHQLRRLIPIIKAWRKNRSPS